MSLTGRGGTFSSSRTSGSTALLLSPKFDSIPVFSYRDARYCTMFKYMGYLEVARKTTKPPSRVQRHRDHVLLSLILNYHLFLVGLEK